MPTTSSGSSKYPAVTHVTMATTGTRSSGSDEQVRPFAQPVAVHPPRHEHGSSRADGAQWTMRRSAGVGARREGSSRHRPVGISMPVSVKPRRASLSMNSCTVTAAAVATRITHLLHDLVPAADVSPAVAPSTRCALSAARSPVSSLSRVPNSSSWSRASRASCLVERASRSRPASRRWGRGGRQLGQARLPRLEHGIVVGEPQVRLLQLDQAPDAELVPVILGLGLLELVAAPPRSHRGRRAGWRGRCAPRCAPHRA